MSVTWHNAYVGISKTWAHYSASSARDGSLDGFGKVSKTLDHVEMRIDGHWLRPPVGMRAEDASHEWRIWDPWGAPEWELRAREPEQRRRDAEFSRKVRSTQA